MSRRPLRVAEERPAAEAALRALAEALRPFLRELDAQAERGEQLLDVAQAIPLPRRTLFAACRTGALVATKRGRRWLASRAAITAWMLARGPVAVKARGPVDELANLRARLSRGSR